jgi:phosphatidylglycerol---prolipoprotein diacylglyceryl transferase
MLLHTLFDALALIAAFAIYRWLPIPTPQALPEVPREPWRVHRLYIAAGSLGATLGAYIAGSANLWLSGIGGAGRSIEGALAGAIVAIEILKARAGIRFSTGLRFVAPLAAAIAVGRIGCFLAGLDDMTYGTPTSLPWGVDFGDGLSRHPVQLYESMTMAIFLAVFVVLLWRGNPSVLRSGFYLFVGVYAAQRFLWEFLKPYGTVIGPFNLFHLLSLALLAYAILFARREAPRTCSTLVQSSP